jgi:hypothetical protein
MKLLVLGTFFASSVTLAAKEAELKGRKPLKTAQPPRVSGYSSTLAMLKAPEEGVCSVCSVTV